MAGGGGGGRLYLVPLFLWFEDLLVSNELLFHQKEVLNSLQLQQPREDILDATGPGPSPVQTGAVQ